MKRHVRTILDEIADHKRQEIASLPSIDPILQTHRSLLASVLRNQAGLIAEIKPKSPSAGHIISREQVPGFVELYRKYAQAISVLCDERYFGGSFDLLRSVRDQTDTPILAKEFILDEKQVDHAAHAGAGAILLIAAILDPRRMSELAQHAISLNLDVLIETHDLDEAEEAATAFLQLPEHVRARVLLGINNRNLKIMKTDLATTERVAPFLRQRLPGLPGLISESGIKTRADIERLMSHADGFLVGESILTAKDPEACIASLTQK